jgi:hypothetical protein
MIDFWLSNRRLLGSRLCKKRRRVQTRNLNEKDWNSLRKSKTKLNRTTREKKRKRQQGKHRRGRKKGKETATTLTAIGKIIQLEVSQSTCDP